MDSKDKKEEEEEERDGLDESASTLEKIKDKKQTGSINRTPT